MTQSAISDAMALIGDETQDDWLDDVVASSTATSVTSRGLRRADASADFYVDAWFLLVGREHPERERVVETYDTTGTLHWPADALAVAPGVGDRFQVWTRWRPRDVERALIRALREQMSHIRVDTLTGAQIDGKRQVALSTYLPWLASPNQVIAVTRLDGSAPAQEEEAVGNVLVRGAFNGGAGDPQVTLSLQAQYNQPFAATDTLQVYSWAKWADDSPVNPGSLTTDTTAAKAHWWAWEAIYMLATKRQYRDRDLEQRAVMRLNELRPLFQPEVGYRMIEPREAWGPSGIAGW